jgi:DNA mismatch endonuclease, patch repair protein
MSKIRSKNTKLELDFIKSLSLRLYPLGFRYRKHYRKLFGNPDIAFVRQKVVVFVDSEFWHGYMFKKNKKALKTKFWLNKIERNISRGKEVNKVLKKEGWTVIRFWEKQVKKQAGKCIAKIERELKSR